MKQYYTHYETCVFILPPSALTGFSALANAPMISAGRSAKEILQVISGLMRNLAAMFTLGAFVLSFASGRVSASQVVKSAANANDANAQAKPDSGKSASASGENAMKRAAQAANTTQNVPPTVSPTPKQAEHTRATPFNGSLRDLPQTKPVSKERPARKPPKLRPKSLPPHS